MKRALPSAVEAVLLAARYTRWNPHGREHRTGFAVGFNNGCVAVYHTNPLWAGPQDATENDLSIVAYARTLKEAGYIVEPVAYKGEEGVLHHYLNVSLP